MFNASENKFSQFLKSELIDAPTVNVWPTSSASYFIICFSVMSLLNGFVLLLNWKTEFYRVKRLLAN